MPRRQQNEWYDDLMDEFREGRDRQADAFSSPAPADPPRKTAAKKKKKTRMDPVSRFILTLSVIVFIGSGGFLLYKYFGEPILEQMSLASYKNDYDGKSTNTAENGKWEADKEEAEPRLSNGMLASFENIVSQNNDVVGWITIPGTQIDYPVVQTKNNSFYLNHNINKDENASGCPFMDYRDVVGMDTLSPCTLIYGHHRRNGTMFATLKNYNDLDFFKQNPVMRFDTVYNRYEWVIFANFRATASSATGVPFNYIRTQFKDDEAYAQFIEDIRVRSLIDVPVEVTTDDHILLLSTCSYEKANWRMIIAARLVRKGETNIDVSGAKFAAHPLMP